MKPTRQLKTGNPRAALPAILLLAGVSFTTLASAAPPGSSPEPSDDATIVHVLNRLAWGPRPGDVEAVRETGVEAWIERQLRPDRIDDDDIEEKLARLETVGLSSKDLLEGYNPSPEARQDIQKMRAELGEDASDADRRRARRQLMEKYRSTMEGSPRQVLSELQSARVLRAVQSERQLEEVLVDFWFNHFNVYAQKGPVRYLVAAHEKEIRDHAWGRFEDLLLATAKSPAMLFYLDNWLSVDPEAAEERQQRRERMMRSRGRTVPQGAARRSGLNENYARELLELHTLGVDGGYTQEDVTEVARAFTGWTIRGLRQNDPEFAFDSRVHDDGRKTVLGDRVDAGGEGEGREIIRRLARHPQTAHFVSYKLARRLVADEPPEALVGRAAATWQRTGGEIREVVRTIVTSPEFLGPEHRSAKVKTPLEFVVSAVRAGGAAVSDARDLSRRIGEMGMPLYLQQPPTGYKDTADAWVSTSGLVARLNFALDLAAGRVRGVSFDRDRVLRPGTPDDEVSAVLAASLVPSGLSEETRQTLEKEAEAGLSPTRVAGLILGSPEFQRR